MLSSAFAAGGSANFKPFSSNGICKCFSVFGTAGQMVGVTKAVSSMFT